MKQSEIILSTVALTTVMMMSSLHFTSDVQAAERPAVTSELTNYSDDDEGDEITRWVTDKDGNMIPFYGDTYPSDSFTTPITQQKTISVVSYKQKLDICKGTTIKISDLNIKMSSYCNPDFKFSNGKTSMTFDELGTHSETVKGSYNGQDFSLAVTVYVKEEEAPTINGVHDIKCLWSGVPKSAQPVEKYAFSTPAKCKEAGINYSKYLIDPNTEQIYKPTQLLKLGITATDCHGNKIPAKNIKVTGYNVYKYNKNQKITYTVTDSEGRTATKSCNLYIDNGDRYYKKSKNYTVVEGGYLSESSYFDEFGASYISVKPKKVKFKDELGRDDGSHYVPATKPIKVKVGQKLKVVGYVVNPGTNKPWKIQGCPIKIVEYNGKQYYYCWLCSNPTSKYLKEWANSDCSGLYGGGLGITQGLWFMEGSYSSRSDCSVSNYLLRRYFEDIHERFYYDNRDMDDGGSNKSLKSYFNSRASSGYQSVYVNGKEPTDYAHDLEVNLKNCGVDLSVDDIGR